MSAPFKRILKIIPSLLFSIGILILHTGCTSLQNGRNTRNAKVALVNITGESSAREIIEVAFINQCLKQGSFLLIPREEVDKARLGAEQDVAHTEANFRAIANKTGANYALAIKVLTWEAKVYEGFQETAGTDSALAAEQGSSGETNQPYRIKRLSGQVRLQLEWFSIHQPTPVLTQIIDEKESITTDPLLPEASQLPPQLSFLSQLTAKGLAKNWDTAHLLHYRNR